MVGLAVLEIEAVKLGFFAESFYAFDGSPSGSALSVLIVVLIAGSGLLRHRSCLGRGSCLGLAGLCCCLDRKLVPACLHAAVHKGVVLAFNLFVNFIFNTLARIVEVVP